MRRLDGDIDMMQVCSSLVVLFVCILGYSVADATEPSKYAIKAGKIVTMAPAEEFATDKNVIDNGVILVSNGKIEALGPASSIQIPVGYTVIEASDRWVMPGIVEAHTHIGTKG